jgi:hypothetical protein
MPWISWSVTPEDALYTSHMVFYALLNIAPYPSLLGNAFAALAVSTDDRDIRRRAALGEILHAIEG